jgi:divalent metal cation (Fe/Co/Zn/Cd) transporter
MVSLLKGLGYLVSTFSVILLGIVAWKGAKDEPVLFACLIAGMAASVIGMGLRWVSHRLGEKEKRAIEAEAEDAKADAGSGDAKGLRAA